MRDHDIPRFRIGPAFVLPIALLVGCRGPDRKISLKPENPIKTAIEHVDFTKAFQLAQAADASRPETQFYLGRMYEEGWGPAGMDSFRALQYYKKAADGGDTRAEVFLATGYERGFDGTIRMKECLQLLQDAAAKGNVQAPYLLSAIQNDGRHKPAPAEQAHIMEIFTVAADAGDPGASYALGMTYTHKTLSGTNDAKLARKYLIAATDSNTIFPGSLAASTLFEKGTALGVSAAQSRSILYRYLDAGSGPLIVEYLKFCVDKNDKYFCDPVHVIKYNGGVGIATFLGRGAPKYLSMFTKEQKAEGQRLSEEWQKATGDLPLMPQVPVDYFFAARLR